MMGGQYEIWKTRKTDKFKNQTINDRQQATGLDCNMAMCVAMRRNIYEGDTSQGMEGQRKKRR